MAVVFKCPGCAKAYKLADQMAGKSATCKCGTRFKVPVPKTQKQAPPKKSAHCPSCTAEIEPGQVICTNCGYNLKTGQKMQAPTSQEPDHKKEPGTYIRDEDHGNTDLEAEKKKFKAMVLTTVLVLALLATLGGLAFYWVNKPPGHYALAMSFTKIPEDQQDDITQLAHQAIAQNRLWNLYFDHLRAKGAADPLVHFQLKILRIKIKTGVTGGHYNPGEVYTFITVKDADQKLLAKDTSRKALAQKMKVFLDFSEQIFGPKTPGARARFQEQAFDRAEAQAIHDALEMTALTALAATGKESYLKEIPPYLYCGDLRKTRAAIMALGHYQQKAAPYANDMAKLANAPDTDVRNAARATLPKLGPRGKAALALALKTRLKGKHYQVESFQEHLARAAEQALKSNLWQLHAQAQKTVFTVDLQSTRKELPNNAATDYNPGTATVTLVLHKKDAKAPFLKESHTQNIPMQVFYREHGPQETAFRAAEKQAAEILLMQASQKLLAHYPKPNPAFAQALKALSNSRTKEVRTWVAQQAGLLLPHFPESVGLYLDLTQGRGPQAQALLAREGEKLVPHLLVYLKDHPQKLSTGWQALKQAHEPSLEKAVPVLVALLNHKSTSVKTKSANYLGSLGPKAKAALPTLLALLKAAGNSRRSAYYQAILRIDKTQLPGAKKPTSRKR